MILKNLPRNEKWILYGFSFLVLVIHLYTNIFASYGIFRDEFYYLACSNNLAFGYVDQPPLSILILAFVKFIFGDSLFAIRFLPAILHSATIFIIGIMTYELGGKKSAVLISCLLFFTAPVYWAFSTYYSMNSIDFFLWSFAFLVLIYFIKSKNKNLFYILFLIIGIGLLNKISFLWFGFGLAVSFLITNLRKFILAKEFITGAVISVFIFSPFIIWNFQNHFAHLEFMQNAVKFKYYGITRTDFLSGLILILNPVAFPVLVISIMFFLFNKNLKDHRSIVIIFIVTFLILLINGKSKSEYLASASVILFVFAGIFLENFLRSKITKILIPVYLGLILFTGILIIPMVIPILPVEKFISYSKTLGIEHQNSENKKLADLPQFYADMFEWETLAANVSLALKNISPEDKKDAVIFAQNYGEAGALEYYSKKYELPEIISSHNNYWLWGSEKVKNKNLIVVLGGDEEDHRIYFDDVKVLGSHKCKHCMPYENNLQIYICKGLKKSFEEIWPEIKNYN